MTSIEQRRTTGSGPLTERYDEALAFAAAHHRQQLRKGSQVPYLSHLLSVSALVLEHGGSESQAIAGLLHDAVEDAPDGQGPAVLAEIAERFGDDVAAIVAVCSDNPNVPGTKPPWEERKRAYVASLATEPVDALLVTACDKIHNGSRIAADVRTYGPDFWTTFGPTREQLHWYYGAVSAVIGERLPGTPVAAALARTVADLQSV